MFTVSIEITDGIKTCIFPYVKIGKIALDMIVWN